MILESKQDHIKIKYNYIEGDINRPVYILLHGIFSNWERTFDKQIDFLKSNNNTIIAPDMPGHGNSSSTDNLTIQEIVDAIYGLLKKHDNTIKDRNIIIIGHSLGTFVAQRLAYDMQSAGYKVSHIILIAGFLYILDRPTRILYNKVMSLGSKISEERWDKLLKSSLLFKASKKTIKSFKNIDHETLVNVELKNAKIKDIETLKNIFNEPIEEIKNIDVSNINYKIISIRGSRDPISSLKDFRSIAKFYYEKCYSTRIKDGDHLIQRSQPEKINEIIKFWEDALITQK